jgi:membrane protein
MDESVGLGRRDRFAHWPRAMRMSCRSSTSTSPHAGSTWLLFRAAWGAVLWRVYQKMNDNRLLAVAAGVVFYGLLAVFPAVTAFVSLYGLMADPSTIHERLALATDILPQGALNILNEQLTRLTSHRTSALSAGFMGGLLVALWSANAGAKAVGRQPRSPH